MSRSEAALRFVKDVASHTLRVIRADGVHRHLMFKRPDSSVYWFELLTWPGALCIRGDMGCFVFSRTEDMFEFFRSNGSRDGINPGYWSEKCVSTREGYEQFSDAGFRHAVVSDFRGWWRDCDVEDYAERRECWRELREDVLAYCDSHHDAMERIDRFSFKRQNGRTLEFQDFWEHRLTEYTLHFLWCLHAIVYGIAQFDASQPQEQAA